MYGVSLTSGSCNFQTKHMWIGPILINRTSPTTTSLRQIEINRMSLKALKQSLHFTLSFLWSQKIWMKCFTVLGTVIEHSYILPFVYCFLTFCLFKREGTVVTCDRYDRYTLYIAHFRVGNTISYSFILYFIPFDTISFTIVYVKQIERKT